MNAENLRKQFARMGAQLELRPQAFGFSVDVEREQRATRFAIALGPRAEASVGDVQPRDRHLVLVVSERFGAPHKFLCGHDERDWFAAALPDAGVSNVRSAKEALKPAPVRLALERMGVKRQHRNRRRNAAFVRQGEWFFLPVPTFRVDPLLVLRNEPISRGRGKPHMTEFLVRTGGELVYVSREHPQGLSETRYRRLIAKKPKAANLGWIAQRRNPAVFVRGRVRHPDHKTIQLDCWHQVVMNTENQAASMRHLAFLD
jgi:hypothetical protein